MEYIDSPQLIKRNKNYEIRYFIYAKEWKEITLPITQEEAVQLQSLEDLATYIAKKE